MKYGSYDGRKYRYEKRTGRQFACKGCGEYMKGFDNISGGFFCMRCIDKHNMEKLKKLKAARPEVKGE